MMGEGANDCTKRIHTWCRAGSLPVADADAAPAEAPLLVVLADEFLTFSRPMLYSLRKLLTKLRRKKRGMLQRQRCRTGEEFS